MKKSEFIIKNIKYFFVLSVIAFSCKSTNKNNSIDPIPNKPTVLKWDQIADSSQLSLGQFWNINGQFYTKTSDSSVWVKYWPSAHALDVLVDLYLRKPTLATKAKMDSIVIGVKIQNGNTYINYYYDDMEWMALSCHRAYLATNDFLYKSITDLLWNDIKYGWDLELGGGIWWRKDHPSKNTPSNLPAAILAARLYRKYNNPSDLAWARKIYKWQKSVLYEPTTGLVFDHLDSLGNKNTSWKFTYNQGVFIGAALELYSITDSAIYLNDALLAADYTLNSELTNSIGILKDEGGGDGGLFKGIFIRYFNRLIIDGRLDNTKKTTYINFMKLNAEKLWSTGTNKNKILFGSAWNIAPSNYNDFTLQLSGIMLFEAMYELKKLSLVE